MASRFLLTLLALLTGLAAQVSPARASECARAAQVVAAVASPVATRASSVLIALREAPCRESLALGVDPTPINDFGRILALAPVLPGIDRAHE